VLWRSGRGLAGEGMAGMGGQGAVGDVALTAPISARVQAGGRFTPIRGRESTALVPRQGRSQSGRHAPERTQADVMAELDQIIADEAERRSRPS